MEDEMETVTAGGAPDSVESTIASARRYRDKVLADLPGLIIHRGDHIVHCNEGLARLLGYQAPDDVLVLPSVLDLVPEDALVAERSAYAECLAGVTRSDLRRTKRRRADRSVQWFDQLLEPIDWGGEPAVLEMLARVRPPAGFTEMPEQWQLLQAAIDAMPNGVLMLAGDLCMEG
ncbi:PAS domain-containing protein [Azospirillum thermophilum]|uniref:PAS domain-containing protein n=1 Tax=Azospirillum thermophilum TaxID=2202148 RepID=UPI001FE856AE|nr:PAS domain-containing protein [Azospirillum thermophilum]